MSYLDKTYEVGSSIELGLYNKFKNYFNVVFDVGSREDMYFHEMHPSCEYHLFEPHPEFYKNLVEKVKKIIEVTTSKSNIYTNNLGLGRHESLSVPYYNKSQSIHVNPYAGEGPQPKPAFSIKLSTLDKYCSDRFIDKIDFLKIDTEGNDYEVFSGGKKMVEKDAISFIQFEFWRTKNNTSEKCDIWEWHRAISQKYKMFLLMEPPLMKNIVSMNLLGRREQDRKLNMIRPVIPVTEPIMDWMENVLLPSNGGGGNIFCEHRKINSKFLQGVDE